MTTGESDAGKLLYESIMEREQKLAEARAERANRPFNLPDIRESDAESYALCIPPSQALGHFNYSSRELSVTQFHREIRSSRVQAVCHQAIVYVDDAATDIFHAIIDSWVWHLELPSPDDGFWETGYFKILVPETMGRTSWRGSIEFFGVRVWPDGLPGGADNPLPLDGKREVAADEVKPTVSKTDLARWHEVFRQVHPDAIEALAMRSATAMFPDNQVPRQWVRDLRGPQKRGKPATRQR